MARQKKDEPTITWERTDIEKSLTNEWNQAQVDGNFVDSLVAKLTERDPEAAAKLLEKFKQEAIDQWQSNNS